MSLSEIGSMLKELVAKADAKQVLASEVAELKAQLVAANTAKTSAESALSEAKSHLAAKESEASGIKAAKDKADADLAAANVAKEQAESKHADLLANPSKVALELAAKAGVKFDQRPQASVKGDKHVASSSVFSAMSISEKMAFSKSGGRISA